MNKPKQPIKIAFFDIDETLYVKNEGYIPRSISEQVLPRLKEKGIITAIASGRGFGAFPPVLYPLIDQGYFDLFVTVNGQHNFYQNQIISQYPLSRERIEQVVAKLNEMGIIYAFVSPDEIALSATNDEVHAAITPIKLDYVVDPDFYKKETIIQMLAFYPASQDSQIAESGLLGADLKAVRWHEIGVDILGKDNSKARGIHDVLTALNLDIDNAIAFGDGLNDIEMFNSVGFAVAMGNAEPVIKELADFVTKPIDQDGILYAIEQLEII